MQLGMIGLGRMGANLVRRLIDDGHRCVVYDVSADAVKALETQGATGSKSLEDFVGRLERPRALWIMVPAAIVQGTLDQLASLLDGGDIIIDGGNSYYRDDIVRAKQLAQKNIHYVDCGTSGGVDRAGGRRNRRPGRSHHGRPLRAFRVQGQRGFHRQDPLGHAFGVRRSRREEGIAMEHELVIVPDGASLATKAARFVKERAGAAVADWGRFTFAVSGGKTPWAMITQLAREEVPWKVVEIFQVDERVAPDGDPDRNLTHLRQSLGTAPARVLAMPDEDPDLEEAASAYSELLPDRFDLVHLGLGPDGHTASLVPGDPVLEVSDRLVAVTQPYQEHRRMTLTYPALARAGEILWLISGEGRA